MNVLDVSTYFLGASFMSAAVIIPLYLGHFTSNPIIFSLIPALGTAGFLLPQLFAANITQRLPYKRYMPVIVGIFSERLPVILYVPAVWFLAKDHPTAALVVTLLLYAWWSFGAGYVAVGWQDLIAKVIPVERRGFFFGLATFLGNITGLVGASVAAWMLNAFDFPAGFGYAFIVAAVFISISWVFLYLVREWPSPPPEKIVSEAEYFRTLPAILKADKNFTRYLITQIVVAIAGLAAGFLIVFPTQNWSLSDSQAGTYSIALLLGTSLANLIFGQLADRKGHKLVLQIAILLALLTFGLAAVAPSALWFYVVFFLRGASMGGFTVSNIMIALEFCSDDVRPTYIGLANTIPGIASSLAPLAGGLLAHAIGYRPVFLIAAIITVGGLLLMRYWVHEPRHLTKQNPPEPAGEAHA